jgi:prophage regulatory protein
MSNPRFYRARDLVGTKASRRDGERGILSFSPALLWRMVQRGQFPKPVKLSAGVTAWQADAVDAWIAERRDA